LCRGRYGDVCPKIGIHFRLSIVRCEDRPDWPAGELVYRLKDLFTTRNGSWELSSEPGSVIDWARQTYLRPFGAPDYFDDAGGDHHLFARVLGVDGQPVKTANLVRYWSDGFAMLGNTSYNGYTHMTPKERSGWANLVMFNSSYSPDRSEQGPWCWCPEGAADVVVGGGMPWNHHISFFAVWQAERRQTEHGGESGGGSTLGSLEDVRRGAWDQLGVRFNPGSAFARCAREHGLGGPLTNEFDLAGYRAQGFVNGIVLAPIDQWQAIQHIGW
jgi:hypothetical protein